MLTRSGAPVLVSGRRMTVWDVGGKFHRQNDAIRAGLNVPPFFCLTASFYRDVFGPLAGAASRVLEGVDYTRAEELRGASEEILQLFLDVDLSPRVERLVFSAFDRLLPGDGLVSVRASMIGVRRDESADSSRHPFAGMSESFLYVRKQDLLDRVRRCAASGFSAESILYRHKQGFSPTAFAVAVGVQTMVFGARSFVLFTCNPQTTARETVIIAGHGIGAKEVVQGVAVITTSRGGPRARLRLVPSEQMLTLAPEGYGVCPRQCRHRCARPPPVRRRGPGPGAIGRRIERLFGAPQDIEERSPRRHGAYPPVPADCDRYQKPAGLDQRERHRKHRTSPRRVTYSMARDFYRVIFHDCYRRLGIGPRAPDDHLHRSTG